ncbi:DNA alkylation repair protein [Plebeiibacterium marinum]|uniref:DNA alkylation repair protein n=1 Tax=Plebeiibacterium marinum TaxID=2992111 RepID=A0AAE3SKL8_9BACT|nr:DNA alkylation repair protein [Plebeiobacterium marinum]MCW3806559.1 DNA alkylation repair protein [Plebeiobacterium marinum]
MPWAVALPDLKKDPAPIFPILENLKNDESDFVRKSVANNLNDISKDHPDVVLDMASQWKGTSKNTDWIVKHACRTLLKQAHPKAMSLFGFNHSDDIKVNDFKINTPKVVFGNHLDFSFSIKNNGSEATTIRLEYYIYFIKANGSLAKKIFKISEKNYSASSNNIVQRKHAIKPITTRKYYPGLHQIALVVNGKELHKHDFELLME